MSRRRAPKMPPEAIVSSRPAGLAAAGGASDLEAHMAFICRTLGLSPVTEYEFATSIGRRWRFDFAFPDRLVAVEVEGGIWARDADGRPGGRHNRAAGFEEDCRKYNAAAVLGWTVLRFTDGMLTSGEARETLQSILGSER